MARPRKPSSKPSAYERRIRRYLELHPGATRQEARGHRLPEGVRSEYEKRVAGATTPAERRRRAGHAGKEDLIREAHAGDLVSVIATKRDKDGRLTQIQISKIAEDGSERDYWINTKRMTQKDLDDLIDRLLTKGIVDDPSYPLAGFHSNAIAGQAAA